MSAWRGHRAKLASTHTPATETMAQTLSVGGALESTSIRDTVAHVRIDTEPGEHDRTCFQERHLRSESCPTTVGRRQCVKRRHAETQIELAFGNAAPV
jgi:hypothetical protein